MSRNSCGSVSSPVAKVSASSCVPTLRWIKFELIVIISGRMPVF